MFFKILKWIGYIFISAVIFLFLFLASIAYSPGQKFIGSPPRKFVEKRNNLELYQISNVLSRIGKLFRVTTYANSTRPTEIFCEWHQTSGWIVIRDTLEVRGIIKSLRDGPDDDVIINLILLPDYELYGDEGKIKVEIDARMRYNFPVLDDLMKGDTVLVKGRWVVDKEHGEAKTHLESHPAYWIEILNRKHSE